MTGIKIDLMDIVFSSISMDIKQFSVMVCKETELHGIAMVSLDLSMEKELKKL